MTVRLWMMPLISVLLGAACTETSEISSRLPPNSFDGAINLGVIDLARESKAVPALKLFPCERFETRLNSSDPIFATVYYKFTVSTGSGRLYVFMNEDPPTTIWIHLYDGARRFLKPYRGNAAEEVNEVLPRGEYYLQILTEENTRHRPDGSNVARILLRGFPAQHPTNQETEPIALGTLDVGRTLRHDGALSHINSRRTAFTPQSARREDCPIGGADTIIDLFDEFVVDVATPGAVRVGVTRNTTVNWLPEFAIYRFQSVSGVGGWEKVTGSFVVAQPGPLRLLVGYKAPATFTGPDMYVQYTFDVSR